MNKNPNSPLGHNDKETAAQVRAWQKDATEACKWLFSQNASTFQSHSIDKKYELLQKQLLGLSLFADGPVLQKLWELGVSPLVTQFFQPVESFVKEFNRLKNSGVLKKDVASVLHWVRPWLEYIWSNALRYSLGVVELKSHLPEPLDDYPVLLQLFRARERNGGCFPLPNNDLEKDLIRQIHAMEKQFKDKYYVRYCVLLLTGEQDKIYWAKMVEACELIGKEEKAYQPLLPLYRMLNPHLSEVDEAAYIALCQSAGQRLEELFG